MANRLNKWLMRLRASDGRIRIATLAGISAMVAVLAVLGMLPALAGSGGPSGAGVQPVEIAFGGGSGACFANIPGRLPSAATKELHINNPMSGTYVGPDGTQFQLTVKNSDTIFDFVVLNNPTMAVYDVIVNGGSKSTHFDYDDHGGPGPVRSDTGLHAPTKSRSLLYALSHINICYDINPFADLSVTKTPVAVNGEPTGNGSFVADVGDTVEFDITVANSASSSVAATGVQVVDTLPSGMSFSSASGGGVENPTGTVTWTISSIAPGGSVTLDLFVTITEAGAGSDLVNQVSVSGNEADPTPGNDDANSIPPVTVTADLSGKKYHDRDTDGSEDVTEESGLEGWTITAFDEGGVGTSATTEDDGSYSIQNLLPGTYTICEATNSSGLPDDGPGFTWSWTQSQPAESGAADCSGFEGYEPLGYTVDVDDDITGIDFGNHRQVTVSCSDTEDVVVTLGEPGTDDNPLAMVTFPAGCDSENFTTTFDVGRSDPDGGDSDPWTQFVVFGGDPTSSTILFETINWDAEPANYVDGSLVVPTTQVQLLPGGILQPVVFCSTLPGSDPNSGTSQCLDSRIIAEGGSVPEGNVQLTENYEFLGDPGNFR